MVRFVIGFFILLLIGCGSERIVYVEIDRPIDEELIDEEPVEATRVTISIVSSRTSFSGGVSYVTVSGKVKNYGPSSVNNVKVIVSTDEGYTRMKLSSPSFLEVGGIGSWAVSNIQGGYIQSKAVIFDIVD